MTRLIRVAVLIQTRLLHDIEELLLVDSRLLIASSFTDHFFKF